MSKRLQLCGRRFGRWVVVKFDGTNPQNKGMWVCQCDCGRTGCIQGSQLRVGRSRGCRSCAAANLRLDDIEVAVTRLWSNYRRRTRIRGQRCSLTKAAFRALVLNDCVYCGQPPRSRVIHGKARGAVNGIDRVNTRAGYVKANCVSCCPVCNRAKRDLPLADFLAYLNRLVAFRSSLAKPFVSTTHFPAQHAAKRGGGAKPRQKSRKT